MIFTFVHLAHEACLQSGLVLVGLTPQNQARHSQALGTDVSDGDTEAEDDGGQRLSCLGHIMLAF